MAQNSSMCLPRAHRARASAQPEVASARPKEDIGGEKTKPSSCALARASSSSSSVLAGLGKHPIGAKALGSYAGEPVSASSMPDKSSPGDHVPQGALVLDIFDKSWSGDRIQSGEPQEKAKTDHPILM